MGLSVVLEVVPAAEFLRHTDVDSTRGESDGHPLDFGPHVRGALGVAFGVGIGVGAAAAVMPAMAVADTTGSVTHTGPARPSNVKNSSVSTGGHRIALLRNGFRRQERSRSRPHQPPRGSNDLPSRAARPIPVRPSATAPPITPMVGSSAATVSVTTPRPVLGQCLRGGNGGPLAGNGAAAGTAATVGRQAG